MKPSARTYTSARARLLRLSELGSTFQGAHAMQLFGWRPKTAAHYLWQWSRQGLVKPLGGKSDLFFNLAVDPAAENRIEAAIRQVMPGAVVGSLNVLNESGLSTQRPGTLQLLLRREDRRYSIASAQVELRPPSWWAAIERAKGIDPGSEEILARLRPGAALADSALSPHGLAPDDIDFDAVTPVERRRAIRILRMLSPAARKANLEKSYTAAWRAGRLRAAPGRGATGRVF